MNFSFKNQKIYMKRNMYNYSQVVDPMSEEGQALQRKKEFKSSINAWGSDACVHIIYILPPRIRALTTKARTTLWDLTQYDGHQDGSHVC